MSSPPSSPRLSLIPARDQRRMFSIIARPQQLQHQQLDPHYVLQKISEALTTYAVPSTITYIAPNYIIQPTDPAMQPIILSWSPLEISDVTIDLVGWSREDEDTKLPWIPDKVQGHSAIHIDPLRILPSASKKCQTIVTTKLGDNVAEKIGLHYDLRAPDYSFLVINEIKNYYRCRHATLLKAKETVIHMARSLQQYIPDISSQGQKIEKNILYLQLIEKNQQDQNISSSRQKLATFLTELITQLPTIGQTLHSIQNICHQYIDVENYRDIPPLSEIPVPASYTTRLKVIHEICTHYVYGEAATVLAVETHAGTFDAYITVGKSIHKHVHAPMKNASSAETAAIYQSLKYITNVLGFQIMDLNYSTLELLISALHKHISDISSLQFSANNLIGLSQQIYEMSSELTKEIGQLSSKLNNSSQLYLCTENLRHSIDQFHTEATTKYHRFMDYKEQFFITYLNNASSNIGPEQWASVQEIPEE